MKLRELLNGVPVASCAVDLEMEIAGVSYDSRATQPGDLFVAMTGYADRRPQVYRHGAGKGRGGGAVPEFAGGGWPLCPDGGFPPCAGGDRG